MQELVLVGAGIVNLGLGYFIGYKLTAVATEDLAESIHQLGQQTSDQLNQHLGRIDTVDKRLSSHFPNSTDATQFDDEIRNLIIELRNANRELHIALQQTQNELRSLRVAKTREQGASQSAEIAAVVGKAELSSVAAPLYPSGDSANHQGAMVKRLVEPARVHSSRRPFVMEQLIAPYDFGVIPAASDFQAVECWDIGSDGFSFLLLQPPTFQRLILVLTKAAEKTYLLACVVQTKPIVHRGVAEYHVNCQFITRLPADSFG
jgi:hypothetical protein